MTTFSEFKQMVDNYTEYAGDAKRIIDAADKYYGEQLSSLQADNERLREALKVAMASLGTYGRHPLIEQQANKALQNK
jgi:hypothetical protein